MRSFMTHCVGWAAALAFAGAHAQTAAPASAPSAAPVPKSDSLSGTTYNTPTASSNQAAAIGGAYDLAGIGRRDSTQETILTAPVVGVPYRFDNGVFLFGSALTGIGYNDNVQGLSAGGASSAVLSVQPRLVAELKKAGDRYTLLYTGNFTRYPNSSDDNFNNHELTLAGDNYFSARSRLGWSAGYTSAADPRGSTDRAISTEPDRWHAPQLKALYAYGAAEAQGRFEFEGSYQAKRYDNNRSTTEASDLDALGLSGRFFYRIMPKTHAVVELRRIDSNYTLASSTNDNIDTRLLVGVTWDATAKTQGSFKVGHLRKNYSSSTRTDASGSTWEGNIRWSPLSYSTVDFTTGRTAADSSGVGDYLYTTGSSIAWNHQWASYISSRVTLSSSRTEFVNGGRVDKTTGGGIGLFYSLGSRYRVGLEYSHTNRNSNIDVNDYKRNTTFLSLEGTL